MLFLLSQRYRTLKMPPNQDVPADVEIDNGSAKKPKKFATLPSNAELVKGAGNVHLDEAEIWGGRGIIKDFKRTVGTHWVQEMTNFIPQDCCRHSSCLHFSRCSHTHLWCRVR